jgi:uncharacterized protein
VLLNPAVNPARDLAGYIGELTSYHDPDDAFYFKAEYVTQLRLLTPRAITRPDRYMAVIAKGDEVLDWQEMSGRYASEHMRLLDGGDHALTDFNEELPRALAFLGLRR